MEEVTEHKIKMKTLLHPLLTREGGGGGGGVNVSCVQKEEELEESTELSTCQTSSA